MDGSVSRNVYDSAGRVVRRIAAEGTLEERSSRMRYNAFGELTDPGIQRERLAADMELKEELYGVRWPVDDDFLAALDHGLPDCSGIALGFDRLVMLASGASHIEEVLWLPVR